MKNNSIYTRSLSLLAVGGLCCLLAGSADAQRSGRRSFGNRASAQAASSMTASTAASGTGSSAGGTACPANGTGSATTGTTTGTTNGTTTGTASGATITSTANRSLLGSLSRSANAQSTLLGTGTVSAARSASNQLAVQWSGNTRTVQTVYIAVLNANRQVLQQRTITQLPVQANMTLASTARYYGVQIVYANGTSSTMISAIR